MAAGECHLFLGPEIGEKQDAVCETVSLFLKKIYGGAPPEKPNIEETSFYAGETEASQITAHLSTDSLFSDAKIVHVKNAAAFKKQEVEILVSYIKAPCDGTLLFITSDEIKAEKELEKACAGGKRVFYELKEHQKAQWLRNYWRREGFNLTEDALSVILEMVENNTEALKTESAKLILFFKSQKNILDGLNAIDAGLVEKHFAHIRSESAFTLFSAIAEGDLSKSLEIARSLFAAQESPAAVFGGLSWSFTRYRDYCALAKKSFPLSYDQLKRAGIVNIKTQKDLEAAYRTYGPAPCGFFLSLTCEFDLLLRKDGAALKETLMDLYLCRIMRAKINR
ncbi:MAG: DNA polymerase III subunit delta [Spirochaetaceae bacterium]|jgi:DNA polymerase-3 subunit delta|nr:DNA polymerase III subunit delta [Spirochaetaceae bacterium]